ncbi:hypothetical protein OAJ55_01785 [Candidatus Nitrosopelagicus sp.]|nr:hypothetical protein [Candidatus Nitrosopelagicus sp.]
MAILLLGGTITPVLSQTSPENNHIIINEIEINPLNGSEYIELFNPTSKSVDISEWVLAPSLSYKKIEIQPNTVIEPMSFWSYQFLSPSLKDFGDTVSLINDLDELIDQTPLLIDLDGDAKTWQRSTDGFDTNSISDWKLTRMSPQSSNGQLSEISEDEIYSFTGETDKTEYTFGETLLITGSTTENLFSGYTKTIPEIIKIKIQGPTYYDTKSVYPDHDLNYSANFDIKETLGFNVGSYDVEISYGENQIKTNFIVSEELTSQSTETESVIVDIFTDKKSYIPGETVIVFGDTNSSLEYSGLSYVVLDPNAKEIFQGTIFPNSEFSTVHSSGGGEIYPFSTQLLMSGVNPVYGTYEIYGTYKAQDPIYQSSGVEIKVNTTFQLIEDLKDDVMISLYTDKDVYEIDDMIKITGRSNEIWTEDLELEIIQTGIFDTDSRYQAYAPLSEKFSIKLDGDGKFEYDFTIPTLTQTNLAYGDYLIKVSEYFGEARKMIKIVDNEESFVDYRTPLGLKMDKSEYVLGTSAKIYGKVMNYQKNDNTYNYGNVVTITFTDSSGNSVMSEDRIKNSNDYGKSPNDKLTFTTMPDTTGNFKIDTILHLLQFDIGKYTLNANHYASKTTESVEFEVVTAQSQILPTVEEEEPLTFEVCSSTRNDISEIIKDLKKIGKDDAPASMESVDCDGTSDFVTGEKLVITGKVSLKPTTYLDDSSTKTSGGTQQGHSYTTNYAQSELNYVEFAIPYPQTLTVSSSYRTTPDAGEDYHGGGGSAGNKGGSTSTTQDFQGRVTGTSTDSERSTGYDGQAVLREVTKQLTDMRVKAYPDAEGNFVAVFDLRAGIFYDGIYKLKANYFGHQLAKSFSVTDNSLKGGLEPELILNFDKTEYISGDVVSISGQIKNVYYYDPVSVVIQTPLDSSKINCLVGQSCDISSTKKIRVNEGTDGATFFMNYKISDDSPIGTYTVIADTHFGDIQKSFFVINESDIITPAPPVVSTMPSKVIEKFNRISENKILISLDEKNVDESILLPRVIQGSLFTSARGDESKVNLEITTPSGQCVIGQNSNCLVSESTRKPGEIYSIVSIDDINYKIRYSGNDVRLEKFSIVPEDTSSKIVIDTWNIKIIKDEQPTRFYYKVSYIALE